MNVEINKQIIENSKTIEKGIHELQRKITHVIDRQQNNNVDHQAIIEQYNRDLNEIKNGLESFLKQQKTFEKFVADTAIEVKYMNSEVQRLLVKNNIRDGF